MKNILVLGGIECGKSSTVNALLQQDAAAINETGDTPTEKIDKYSNESIVVWDTVGFGESVEQDEVVKKEVETLICEESDGKRLIDAVLLVIDASSRDMGTEYELISNLLLPNLKENQNIIVALNQCDFAMKGRNWDEENNAPNDKLLELLEQKAQSVKSRIEESTGLNAEPIYYSAIYDYNVDKLREYIMNNNNGENIDVSEDNISLPKIKPAANDASENLVSEETQREQKAEKTSKLDFTAIRDIDVVCDYIKAGVEKAYIKDADRNLIIERLSKIKNQELNIMLVGGTGVGKSSTINALFGEDVATVGESVNPETDKIEKFSLGKVVLWDTPGLGDTPEKDEAYEKQIIELLSKNDESGKQLIDVVLVVIDASSQELGTSYRLINNAIIPNIGDKKRILVALNQCDFAMKGKYWNHETNAPKQQLMDFLQEKIVSITERIQEATGVEISPIYYSALYKYNIAKLFFFLLDSTPDKKRINLIPQMNRDVKVWDSNDNNDDYKKGIYNTSREAYNNTYVQIFLGISKDVVQIISGVIKTTVSILSDVVNIIKNESPHKKP